MEFTSRVDRVVQHVAMLEQQTLEDQVLVAIGVWTVGPVRNPEANPG